MPCSALYASWISRRRFVSPIARLIESVTVSAYRITSAFTFRAARPIVWISDFSLRRKPSLSASRMATSDTSGRSSPSRSRFTPTSTSNAPSRSSRSTVMRSMASSSECSHLHRSPASRKYVVRSSAIRLVSTVTSVRSCFAARLRDLRFQVLHLPAGRP